MISIIFFLSARMLDDQYQRFQIDFPRLEGHFTGTGDSFSSLLLAWFDKDNNLLVTTQLLLFINNLFILSPHVRKPFQFSIKFYLKPLVSENSSSSLIFDISSFENYPNQLILTIDMVVNYV